ncbi:MAG: Membrane-bound dehydrogenase domain protein, partial [Verrucomicrobiales bacterium]|nr:Membrane-bound dehydrogenase domain protein [Verrucomicrobiales bacterium]
RYPEGGPTAPEKAGALLVTHPDFEATLVAAEPLVQKPLSIDWDAKGRMWVAEAIEYPAHTDNSRLPGDRISILEDTNHDGIYDKKTLFYTNLNLVTSLVLYKDGVIVCQAPDIYFLRDTDGDGVADKKEVLYTGLGTSDAHAVMSNMRWGLDGWIYATVGYSRGDIYSGDRKRKFGAITDGVIRFKPDGSAFEEYSSKGSNTWGVDQAADGEIFFSQANGNHINHVVVPESLLGKAKYGTGTTSYKTIEDHNRAFPVREYNKQAYVQIDFVGGFTAAAGACIYDGGAWPAKWNNTFYVSEPTVNLVHQDILSPKGNTYVASKDPERKDQEFFAGKDLWFRPVHQRVGPDGALYVLDFYNQAAVHNDTRGPRHGPNNAAVRPDRDHYFGRIWRVQHKQATKFESEDLSTANSDQLIRALAHPNMTVRMIAQRSLVEKGDGSALPALQKILTSKEAPAVQRLHAIWVINQLDMSPAKNNLFAAVLQNDPDVAVRKNAANALATTQGTISTALFNPAEPDARVRLLSIIAQYNHFNYEKVGRLELPMFSNIVSSLLLEFRNSPDNWSRSAILAVAQKSPTPFLSIVFANGSPENAGFLEAFASQIVTRATDNGLPEILSITASAPAETSALKVAVLHSLESIHPTLVNWNPKLRDSLAAFLLSPDKAVSFATLSLALRWDKNHILDPQIQPLIAELLNRFKQTQDPQELANILKNLGPAMHFNPDVFPAIASVVEKGLPLSIQKDVVAALGIVWAPTSAAEMMKLFPYLHPEARDAAILVLLRRSDGAMALLDALQKRSVDLRSLSPLTLSVFKTNRDPLVRSRAEQVINELRGPELKEKNDLIAKFTPLVIQPGNVENGKKLFTQNCAVCHKFKSEGKDLAPDLTGMGAHGPAELIIHVLDPNRVVEPNFVSTSIETLDDQSYEGILAREDKNAVLLRNASGDVEIKRQNIKSIKSTGRSLMPEGFEALGGESLRDILTYIGSTESQYRIIDLREAFDANSTRGIYQSIESSRESLEFKKFGLVKVENIPFEIVHPSRTSSGNNLLVLKGGSGLARTFPQSVEVGHLGIQANRLHFLGGVGGWAFPCCGADTHMNLQAAKITVKYGDGQNESFILTNGVEIADYNGTDEVPGSRLAEDLVTHGQVRWFSKELQHKGLIEKISIESFNNFVAATFVAITADSGEAQKLSGKPASSSPPVQWGAGLHT